MRFNNKKLILLEFKQQLQFIKAPILLAETNESK